MNRRNQSGTFSGTLRRQLPVFDRFPFPVAYGGPPGNRLKLQGIYDVMRPGPRGALKLSHL
jgi:hypothetical protein